MGCASKDGEGERTRRLSGAKGLRVLVADGEKHRKICSPGQTGFQKSRMECPPPPGSSAGYDILVLYGAKKNLTRSRSKEILYEIKGGSRKQRILADRRSRL